MHVSEHLPVDPKDLILKPGSGHNLLDKINGKYWHIYLRNTRVGKIYIDFIDNEIIGVHPSIDIFINKQFQGRKIGSYAYAMACNLSGLKKIYMHTKKSNIASIKAAADAGFIRFDIPAFRQIVMVWERTN